MTQAIQSFTVKISRSASCCLRVAIKPRFPAYITAAVGFLSLAQAAQPPSDKTTFEGELREIRQNIQQCAGGPIETRAFCQGQAKLRIDLISAEIYRDKPAWYWDIVRTLIAACVGTAGALLSVWGERRKALAGINARSESLAKTLAEVRATQQIQVGLAGSEWDRQMLSRLRCDAYSELIGAGEAIMTMLYRGDDDKDKWAAFSLADSHARVFCSAACEHALDDFWQQRDSHCNKTFAVQGDEAKSFVGMVLGAQKAWLSAYELRAEHMLANSEVRS